MNRLVFSVCVSCLLVTACAPKKAPPLSPSQLTPEQMQAMMQESGKITPDHQRLQKMAGKWNLDIAFWMDPSQPPEVSKGTSQITPVLGGRFVKEDVKSSSKWGPFEGFGMLGYDNVTKQYVSTWTDNMMTDIMTGEGTYDPGSNSIAWRTNVSCPLTNGEKQSHAITRILNDNQFIYEMYEETPDGLSFKTLEISYDRVSAKGQKKQS